MECWLHDQWPVNGESNIGMTSFAERQALLKAQVLGSFASGLENYGNFEQRFWPYDQVLLKQQELYGAVENSVPVSNWGPDGGFNFGSSNFNVEELQQCGFEFESLPIQMQGFGNFQFISMVESQDEDYGYAELNLPAWQTQPSLSEVCCRDPSAERPTNSSFYTLDDVMKKLPRVSPLLIPTPALSLGIPPSPQFSSEVSLSSCLPFSARVPCPPSSLQQSEAEAEHLNQLTQLQSCRKPPYASVEPQSVAARHRRSKIREKIRSLEKLIPQGSKLDTARMLDEAIKYLKFLQAQVQVLEDYAASADSKPDLKSNPNSGDDNVNICVKSNFKSENALMMQRSGSGSNFKSENALMLQRSGSGSNFNSDAARKLALTNALALHRSGSGSFASKKLSADQMLHSLLSSSRIQKKLFSAGKIMVTVQQKEKLASTRPDLCGDYSNFCFD